MKAKPAPPFYFKDISHKEMVGILDQEYPITLKHNEELVNRVAAQYPILKKNQISLIIREVFRCLREFLILGKTINLVHSFYDTKLLFFQTKAKTINPAVKIKISTSEEMRNHER